MESSRTHPSTLTPAPVPSSLTPKLVAVAAGWLGLAFLVAASGVLPRVLPLIGILFALAVGGTIIAWRRSPALRAWTAALDLRAPILLHVVRIGFGALFLVELAAGRLPESFAARAGYGDILAGALAIVAALAAGPTRAIQPPTRARRALVWAFTVFGFADIALVFITAQVLVLGHGDAQMIGVLGHLPYSLLPTFIVPLIVLTHLLTIQRLGQAARASRGA